MGQIRDLWLPCTPIGPDASREQAEEASRASGGRTLVIEDGRLIGAFSVGCPSRFPDLPTVLFPEPVWGREQQHPSAQSGRSCKDCHAAFTYYRPVLEHGILVGYVCPECGASPTPG